MNKGQKSLVGGKGEAAKGREPKEKPGERERERKRETDRLTDCRKLSRKAHVRKFTW